MFFRRDKPQEVTFSDRLNAARAAGFTVDGTLVTRRGVGATVTEGNDGLPKIGEAGLVPNGSKEVARMVHAGYQMFFVTQSGHRIPALAEHLRALHDFTEDLREAMHTTSLYNQGLGSTTTSHLYDRVKDRDRGEPKRAWE